MEAQRRQEDAWKRDGSMSEDPEIVTVQIRRNADGVVRNVPDEDWSTAEWSWTEGNYSCDCNRYLFFERAIGGDPESDGKYRCGDTQYSIRVLLPDGRIWYKEADW